MLIRTVVELFHLFGFKVTTQNYNNCIVCGVIITFSNWNLFFKGSEPSIPDKVVSRKACVSDGNRCACSKFYNIQIRNCSSFLVYNLTSTDTCPERYCFGTILHLEINNTLFDFLVVSDFIKSAKHVWNIHTYLHILNRKWWWMQKWQRRYAVLLKFNFTVFFDK